MRIRIAVQFESKKISVNYNYGISAAIRKFLRIGTPKFSEFILDNGYRIDPKKFDLFTFSLRFEKMVMSGPIINLVSPKAYINLSFPIINDYIDFDQFASSVKRNFYVKIEGEEVNIKGLKIDFLPETSFGTDMRFIFLSPLVLSTFRFVNKKEKTYFLRPEDRHELNTLLRDNLIEKHQIISKNPNYLAGPLHVIWDPEYSQKHLRITKKICIENPKAKPTEVIGILSPCTIMGDSNLIRTGFIAGFGDKTSLGLGMADHLF
jgi:CRISPR-associated endoribonuclease Cas6